MRFHGFICKCTALFAAVMLLAGMCYAAEPAENAGVDRHSLFVEKVRNLKREYGFIQTGTRTFESKNREYSPSYMWPDKEAEYGEGILFADIYDYDGDGEEELLTLRRQRGCVNTEYSDGRIQADECTDYCFEMYEYSEQSKNCVLASRFAAGVFDEFNLFVSDISASVFRSDRDGRTEIFMETFKSMQDHPQVIDMIHLQYNGKGFVDCSGFRYGFLFFGENCVQFQKYKSARAFDYLSSSGGINDFVDVIAAANADDSSSVRDALEKGLEEYGLALCGDESDHSEGRAGVKAQETDQQDQKAGGNAQETDGEEPKTLSEEELDALMELSALGGYDSIGGKLTPLGYVGVHNNGKAEQKGFTSIRIDRFTYSDTDPLQVSAVDNGIWTANEMPVRLHYGCVNESYLEAVTEDPAIIEEAIKAIKALEVGEANDLVTEDAADYLTFGFEDGSQIYLQFEGDNWITEDGTRYHVEGLTGLHKVLFVLFDED